MAENNVCQFIDHNCHDNRPVLLFQQGSMIDNPCVRPAGGLFKTGPEGMDLAEHEVAGDEPIKACRALQEALVGLWGKRTKHLLKRLQTLTEAAELALHGFVGP